MADKNKSTYSIGIVTYHARFDDYFKPLIEKLANIFPDREIVCIINGHPDRTLQINYLNKVTSFMKKFPNVRYLTYDLNQSLSKCWNQLIILSHTDKTVVCNDDISVSELFREELENHIDDHDFFRINRTWSHFVISKNTVRRIGWFEERLPAVAWEDTDYAFRLFAAGEDVPSVKMLGLFNQSTDNVEHGWEDEEPSDKTSKYASANEKFFKEKWHTAYFDGVDGDYKHDSGSPYGRFTLREGMDTPMFYDFSVLDTDNKTVFGNYNKNSSRLGVQKVIFGVLDKAYSTARKVKRFLKKLRQTKLPI